MGWALLTLFPTDPMFVSPHRPSPGTSGCLPSCPVPLVSLQLQDNLLCADPTRVSPAQKLMQGGGQSHQVTVDTPSMANVAGRDRAGEKTALWGATREDLLVLGGGAMGSVQLLLLVLEFPQLLHSWMLMLLLLWVSPNAACEGVE